MKIFPLCLTVLLLAACSHAPDDAKDHGNDPSPAPPAHVTSSDADTSETVAPPATPATDDVASATTDNNDTSDASDSSDSSDTDKKNVFNAYHYKEYNVTCFWLENNNSSFSMSCLPDSQVTRTSENEATETPK